MLNISKRLLKIEDIIIRIFNKLTGRGVYKSDEEILSLFTENGQKEAMERVKKKQIKNVAFFCMGIPLWKYESLMDEMLKKKTTYNPMIFIAPRQSIYSERKKISKSIQVYCKEHGYRYIPMRSLFFYVGQDLKKYNIDIAFYTQPYNDVICGEYSYDKLKDSLLCYVPYSYSWHRERFCYDSILNKIAWKNFYPASCCLDDMSLLNISTKNVVVSGYPGYDNYLKSSPFLWKQPDKKKIIWAPHFSLASNGWLHMSSFMQIYDYMMKIVDKYIDEIQVAFKPHPHLYGSLLKIWGKDRTDVYYNWWKEHTNTMLCTGENYPLFKSSDAMIHDSGSFVVEYMYTQKPCMFLYLNEQDESKPNEAGKAARDAHYKGYGKEDIERFLVEVVLNEKDTKMEERKTVLEKYIIPNGGQSATELIIKELNNI